MAMVLVAGELFRANAAGRDPEAPREARGGDAACGSRRRDVRTLVFHCRCVQRWSISRYVVHLVTYHILTRNEKFGMDHAFKMLSPQGGFFRCKRPQSRRQHVRSLGGRASRARRAPTWRTLLAAALCRW